MLCCSPSLLPMVSCKSVRQQQELSSRSVSCYYGIMPSGSFSSLSPLLSAAYLLSSSISFWIILCVGSLLSTWFWLPTGSGQSLCGSTLLGLAAVTYGVSRIVQLVFVLGLFVLSGDRMRTQPAIYYSMLILTAVLVALQTYTGYIYWGIWRRIFKPIQKEFHVEGVSGSVSDQHQFSQ